MRRQDVPARCEDPDARAVLNAARSSLVFSPYRPKKVYDLDANGRAVLFQPGRLSADALAILSYPDPQRFAGGDSDFHRLAQRSFVYDDALAVLWLTHDGDLDRARRVLATLAALQRPDGAWGFGFGAGPEDGFYNAAYVRTGTVAWVVYALAHYRVVSRDPQFDGVAERATRWLLAQRAPGDPLLRGGAGRWRDAAHFEPDWRADFVATEHQVDAWFALRAASRAWPELAQRLDLTTTAQQLAIAMRRSLWLPEGRYAQGLGPAGTPDRESALDAAGTWTALWEIAEARPEYAQQMLSWVTRVHGIDVDGWPGLRPYRDAPPETWFVEGSVALPLAYKRLGLMETARQRWQPLVQLACAAGLPLVYAPNWHADFPFTPAAAPTLWLLLAGQEIVEGGAPWLWAER